MPNEQTSQTIGSIASRGMRNPSGLTPDEIKRVCASALTQRPSLLASIKNLFSK
jgi:hypothetical protein